MSYLDRIAACNNADLDRFVPFIAGGRHVGWVRRQRLAVLARFADAFVIEADAVRLRGDTFETRTAALAKVVAALVADGLVSGVRGELYAVAQRFGETPLFALERAAMPFFGCRAYGVHVNGFVREGGALFVWVGRRARDKPTYPGMLDNFVAGGQPIGLGLRENLIKEADEEAGVPPALAATARAVGCISYCMESEEGLKPDVQFVFDLELPPDFVPVNRDGEIESFTRQPVAEVMATTRDSAAFKFNCALVNIDFFVRHALLDPEDPDYLDIVSGLHVRCGGFAPTAAG